MKRLLALLLLVFALDCSAQSLADAARKERERQKHLQSKITVSSGVTSTITAGTAGVSATVAASSSGTATSATASAAKPTGPTDNQGRDEKYWRAAFQQARDDVKRTADKVQVVELKLKDLNTKLLTRTDIYDRENRLAPEITATQKELDDARKNAERAKQKVTDLEDELRKSGGLPGWSR